MRKMLITVFVRLIKPLFYSLQDLSQICLNGERQYTGDLKHWNLLNKWSSSDLKSSSEIIQMPKICPEVENGTLLGRDD